MPGWMARAASEGGSGPSTTPDRDLTAGGDMNTGNGPVHYGSVPLPLQANEDVVLESSSSTAHTITQTFRSNGSTSSRPLSAGGSLLIRGRGVQSVSIDSADADVTWAKGPAGTVWPTNPSIGGGAASVLYHAAKNYPALGGSYKMGGFGSTWVFTPLGTGIVKITMFGLFATDAADSAPQIEDYYGTGSAPVQGAAVTGTAGNENIEASWDLAATTPSLQFPFALVDLLELTPGTEYWFDIAARDAGGGSGSVTVNGLLIEELNR